MSRRVLAFLLLLSSIGILWSLDFEARFRPSLSLPLGESADYYTPGGGALLFGGIDIGGFLAPGLEAGAAALPIRELGKSALLGAAGPGLRLWVWPLARLRLQASASGGAWVAGYDGETYGGLWWSGGAGLGWRFSPVFTLGADLRYESYGDMFGGLSMGIGAEISLGAGGGAKGLDLLEEQDGPILPFRYWAYGKEPLGKVRIVNRESAEIRDIEVSLSVPGYESGPLVSATRGVLARGASFEAPLLAALDERVLGLSESTRIQAIVEVSYRLLDAPRDSRKSVALRFENRNALPWKDDREAAAFASPQDPAVLDLSKYVAGLVRGRSRAELDAAVSFAAGFYEAIRLAGIAWDPDPARPFAARRDLDGADYLQYPYQTIAYRGGDSDDLAVLYAALLESVGTRAALVFLKDEVLVAFSVGKDEATVRSQYSSLADLIPLDGEFWAPLKIARIRDGFLRSWQEGANAWRAALAAGQDPVRFTLAEAWKTYPPVGIPGVEAKVQKPAEDAVLRAFDNAMKLLVAREISPKVKVLTDEMGQGGGTGRQRNSLGILYARFGMFPEAKAEFEKATALGYASAAINLGNVLFLLQDYKGAAARYQEVLDRKPQDKAAMIGLARARYELDAFTEADTLFARVRSIDPAFADRYAYLAARTDPTARAAAADSASAALPWADGE